MVHIGIIGDYDETKPTHPATTAALLRAGEALGESPRITWISTVELAQDTAALDACDAIMASPGSPYADFQGALAGIRYARERGRPFLGT
jgi:CTP synthase (UTP-ammonia lyase)